MHQVPLSTRKPSHILPLFLFLSLSAVSVSAAQEPVWSGEVVALGDRRNVYRSEHILDRPYRPFHFYGNTVRRSHYRGFPAPLPRDVVLGSRALLRCRR